MPIKLLRVLVLVSGLVGCYDPHAQQSAIVRQLEAAGSGRLDSVTEDGLTQFLRNHQDLATKIDQECAPLRSQADAHWTETTEGKACHVAQYTKKPTPWRADPRGW